MRFKPLAPALRWARRTAIGIGLGITRGLAQGFDAGSVAITRVRNWLPSNSELTALIVGDGEIMRARARKLERENPWARGAVSTDVANIVGTGITPRSSHPDEAMRKQIDDAWKKDQKFMDADGRSDFYGLQKVVCRRIRVDGEIFARLRFRRPTDPVLLQVQLVEADHCPYSKSENYDYGYVRAGVEFDLIARRVAYWLYRDHPGSIWTRDATLYRIPAEQILHCYEIDRPGQIRGASWLIPSMIMLYDVKQLLDAALLRQKVVNLLSVWIKKSAVGGKILGETANPANDGTASAELAPGSVNYLLEGEEPMFLTPPEVGIAFKEILNSMLRAIARALEMTFEQLSGDLSGTNFSSIKVGILEYRRVREAFQYIVMIFQFCDPVWNAWMSQQILAGRFGDKAGEYNTNPEYFEAQWDPPGWPWINEEDVKTAKASVRAGFDSRSSVIASTGENPEQVDKQNALDNERADKLGLKFDSDGRNVDGGDRRSSAANVGDGPTETMPGGGQPPSQPGQ